MCFNPRTHEGCNINSSYFHCAVNVSIHAPTRGATRRIYRPSCSVEVSIHAPTRGATQSRSYRIARLTFQSTHPRGVRPDTVQAIELIKKFQSTHPRGVRRLPIRSRARLRRFNPRTHEGCDSIKAAEEARKAVSIHAPTRGATPTF